jgi:hypothetical protein
LARAKAFDRWLFPYLVSSSRRVPKPGEKVHVLICVADHFEPRWGRPKPADAVACVRQWADRYPELLAPFRDSDGRPPRHTFFFPVEQYCREQLDVLGSLCRRGFGEVEIQLHHHSDAVESLRRMLRESKRLLVERHGLLSTDRTTGELAYGFVHGDWALGNSHRDGSCCGVDGELAILKQTGCYADFTMPSAPNATQSRIINRIYRAVDGPNGRRGHDWPVAGVPADSLLMIQGPLLLDWRRRKWGIMPRIENGCLQANNPPTPARLQLWLRAAVQTGNRPDWYFVKLHTHGTIHADMKMLLGEPMAAFHRALKSQADEDPDFHYHYVTAREMANLALAAESGWRGSVAEARDFRYVPIQRGEYSCADQPGSASATNLAHHPTPC